MGIRVAQIEAQIDGDEIRYQWVIPGVAHAVGLRAAVGGNRVWLGDDLGSPEGAGALEAALQHGVVAIGHRVRAQWNGCQPLF